MGGWLPDTFGEDQADARASRAIGAVKARAARRARRVRVLRWTAGAAFVTVLAFVLAPKVSRHELHPGDAALVASSTSGPEKAPQGGRGTEPGSLGTREPAKKSKLGPAPPERQRASEPTREDAADVPAPHRPIPSSPHHDPAAVTLEKAGPGVELKWKGDPSKEYVVYRCTTPRFDRCSIAGEVKGTKWTDREADSAPLVFYKVEPKA